MSTHFLIFLDINSASFLMNLGSKSSRNAIQIKYSRVSYIVGDLSSKNKFMKQVSLPVTGRLP